jgi:lantibiotic modifying enzyme
MIARSDAFHATPLATGSAWQSAWTAIDAIAADLGRLRIPDDRAGLADGHAGQALFFGALANVTQRDEHARRAAEHLERAVDATQAVATDAGLFTGFAGVAWTVAHLASDSGDAVDDELEEIDRALLLHLRSPTPCRGNFDLIAGLVGIGVYGLERLPSAPGADIVAEVVRAVERAAQSDEHGRTWRVLCHNIPLSSDRARYADGRYDFGLAHGVAGVIAFLAAAAAAGVEVERSRRLLADAVHWLCAHRNPSDFETTFAMVAPEDPPVPARSAWCYGDPSVAVALFAAAREIGDAALRQLALAIADRDAARVYARSGVQDAGLCHGAAGQLLIHAHLLHATGDDRFGAHARLWLERALAHRKPKGGVGGFSTRSYRVLDSDTPTFAPDWSDDPGLLEGAAGIGLGLLAAVTPGHARWPRILLCSIPEGQS